MMALEVEVPVVDHRVEVESALLPAHASRVRVIVLYDEEESFTRKGPLAEYRAHPFIIEDFKPLTREEANER